MTEYSIKNVKDHILIELDGGLVLVDTGSPLSFHEDGRMNFCENEIYLSTTLGPVDSHYMSEKLGVTVKGLLGMDLISPYAMTVDVKGGVLTFDNGCDTEGWTPVLSSRVFGYMTVPIEVAGKPAKVILDTGAPTSYILSAFNPDAAPLEYVKDFYPTLGDFDTPVYEQPCSFAGGEFNIRFGNLPAGLNLAVSVIGAQGVVGMELLKRFKFMIADRRVFVKAYDAV